MYGCTICLRRSVQQLHLISLKRIKRNSNPLDPCMQKRLSSKWISKVFIILQRQKCWSMKNKNSILAIALLMGYTASAQRVPERLIDKSLITDKINETLAQRPMSPELLWQLGRVSAEGITSDGKTLIYGVSNYSFESNKSEKNLHLLDIATGKTSQFTQDEGGESVLKIEENGDVIYTLKGQLWRKNITGGDAVQLTDVEGGLQNVKFSPDGKHILFSKPVLLKNYHSA